jgi:hypothetical protein
VNDDDEQTKTNIHALSTIGTHSLRVQAMKAHASDCQITHVKEVDYCYVEQSTHLYLH